MKDDAIEKGKEVEGWAFTFCKAAFLALLCGKYAVLVLAAGAAVLYCVSYFMGVRAWRCWVKPPWVVVVFLAVALAQAYLFFVQHSNTIL